MYKIIGSDQKEYGPISGDLIRQWIAEGRINAQTRVQVGGDWTLLGQVPEFADALSSRVSRPPMSAPRADAGVPAKTSGMAITSLVLGILGLFTCGITALVGLVLGLVSMSQIKSSNGRLTGGGVALAGTIVSGAFLLMIPLSFAMFLPAFAKAKDRAFSIACMNNVKVLSLEIHSYAGEHNDQLPSATAWCDAIQSKVFSPRMFQCPGGDRNQRCHFAFNEKLSGMELKKIAPDTVMLFETAEGGWNINGGRELVLTHSRHSNRINVVFADGSVQPMTESQLSGLRWDP